MEGHSQLFYLYLQHGNQQQKEKTMRTTLNHLGALVFATVALLMMPTTADAQNKRSKKHTRTNVVAKRSLLPRPEAPTPVSEKERTIGDLLYFPMACLPNDMNSNEGMQQQLTATCGSYEAINGSVGLHAGPNYQLTYRQVPIGVAYYDCWDHRQWYHFYFSDKAEATRFYNNLAADIRHAGIPLTADKVYGDLSNRKRPVSIFKWVYVSPPAIVKEAEGTNIEQEDVVGMYKVEMGVYKRNLP